MLTSLGIVFLAGLLAAALFKHFKLPGLIGLLLTGILLGPGVLNLLDGRLLDISADLRQVALLITRAGLTLNPADLKKVGRPALLMCFLPATAEIIGMVLLAPCFLGVSITEAALIGSVVAAVSPAVIVPRMIATIEQTRGHEHARPQRIRAGASVDDVYVIVVFTLFTGMLNGNGGSALMLAQVPISIVLGLAVGLLLGKLLDLFFSRFHQRDTVKLLVMLALSFLLVEAQNRLSGVIPFSGLLAVMGVGISMRVTHETLAARLSVRFNKLWVAAEILLFVLVGAAVDPLAALTYGPAAACCVLLALLFRCAGVAFCLIRTPLSRKERLFCIISYLPKATVQAAIGAVPLSMGLACGNVVLTTAVLSILITAPLGAVLIDRLAPRLLADA